MRYYLTLLIASFSFIINAQHHVIPEPVEYQANKDSLVLQDHIKVIAVHNADLLKPLMSVFNSYLTNAGYSSITGGKSTIISVEVSEEYKMHEEGYVLTVSRKGITLKSATYAGAFNGLQTVKQLLPATNVSGAKIEGCQIKDHPRFKWRGLMLDVSRHFFTVDEVKAYLDLMSMFKFNVFHWHLTDDNGWRIEIKSLPELTKIGAWRVERHGTFGDQIKPPTPGEKASYGGFYTQEQIKDVVLYAQQRNITIVPEIDVPGHSMAALAAYPELSTKKEKKYVSPGNKFAQWFGDGTFKLDIENTLDPTNEAVYEFIDKVFTEIAALFPGAYIHMGGDECYKGYWDDSKDVKAFMNKNDIKDSHELQAYFVSRVQKIINAKGKKMIGWNEIIEGGLVKGATVMSWQGMKGGIHAAKAGHEVVMSPSTYAYLDYQQGDLSVENSIYSNLSLKESYAFEPVPDSVDAALILGGQGNVWTEAIPTLDFAYYMTYPRALSIAETVWSPKENKNWDNFMSKTAVHFERFDAQKINVSKAVYEPIVKVYKEEGKLMCKLSNDVSGLSIYYSVNNTYPVNYATKYTEVFEIPEGKLKLRAQCFKDGKAMGRELIITREQLKKRIGGRNN